ncbi:MAG: hypothetical protein A3G93_09465 [Nitrospinae bacterium RIFCSPLOWO2_12_FULL_45_22]|nr:MAG: hypothetical protein A3G93_09465 [Nitrospinae bacterium RIFCSPLOWO2_12_FULL_45_22]
MGKIVFICRDALENSIISNLGMAMEAKKAGEEPEVIFTQEALAALSGASFDWSPLFRQREIRMKIAKNAEKRGIPVASAKDARWTDMKRLIKGAKEAGVTMSACPLWSDLLEVKGKLPPEITEIGSTEVLKRLKEATAIIGNL